MQNLCENSGLRACGWLEFVLNIFLLTATLMFLNQHEDMSSISIELRIFSNVS